MMMYAIYSAMVLALLYWVFFAFLSQETFHRLNRITLLLILAFSLILPVLPHSQDFSFLEVLGINLVNVPYINTNRPEIIVENASVTEQIKPVVIWSWKEIAGLAYLGGVLLYIILFIYRTVLLCVYLKQGLRQTDGYGNTVILIPGCKSPFSILKYIVMSVEDYEQHQIPISLHEQEHIRQFHSLDLLMLSVVQCIQWFNPFVWLLGRDLKVIHEYEADMAMLDYGVDIKNYQYLLVNKCNGPSAYAMVNGFNHSQLISRIIMLNKRRTKPRARARYLILAPMLLLSYVMTAQPIEKEEEVIEFKEIGVSHTLPEYPDGFKAMKAYLRKNLVYPEGCDAEGSVIVQFVVDVDGSIKSPVIVRSVDPLLDAEAIRLVNNMPNWRPGVEGGKLAMSKYTLPISFVKPDKQDSLVDEGPFQLQGKVIDAETRQPVEGVVVIVAGTTNGTVTTSTGEFRLEVEFGQTIKVIMIDYKTSEITVSDKKAIVVPLSRE